MHPQFRQRLDGSRLCRAVALLVLIAGTGLGIPSSSSALPDGRAYELVSPPDMRGTSVLPQGFAGRVDLQAWNAVAVDGSAVLWSAITGPPGAPDTTGFFNAYRSVRGSGAWQSTFVAPPTATGGQSAPLMVAASSGVDRLLWWTSEATIDPSDHDPVATATAQGQFQDLYRRTPDGAFDHINHGSFETPVASESLQFLGASQDLDKIVFADDRQLEPGAPPGGGIYQRDGQAMRLVSKDETGAPIGARILGSSADSSIVAFTTNDTQVLYVWSEQSGDTVRAVVIPGAVPGDLAVDSISADGREIFFTTAGSMTTDDVDTSRDLYRYDTTTQDVTLLSAPDGAGARGNSDACAAPLPGAGRCDVSPVTESRDGSKVYFVSPEQIVAGRGIDGGVNLYLSQRGDIRYVATLDPDDPVFEGGGIPNRHVRVTPDDTKLMFESRAALTSYDSAGHMEVYLYDPGADALTCASCRPNGTAPTGDSFLSLGPGPVGAGGLFFINPPGTTANADESGGRVFFNSLDAIVPKDSNGRNDVYEYTVATRTPALISSGTGERDSTYLGNGVDGRDVFFLTTDTLVPQDRNGNVYKLYDARVGGGFPTSSVPPPCQGASCRPDEAPPRPAPQGSVQIVQRMPPTQPTATVPRVLVSGSRSVKGTSVRLTAKVSGTGSLSVSGRGLVSASRKTSRSASYHLTVRLSKVSIARLRHARRLTLSATVRFIPAATGRSVPSGSGEPTARSVRVRLTFTDPSNRNAR
jgi:hypothetical protein